VASGSQVGPLDLGIVAQLRRVVGEHHPPGLQHEFRATVLGRLTETKPRDGYPDMAFQNAKRPSRTR